MTLEEFSKLKIGDLVRYIEEGPSLIKNKVYQVVDRWAEQIYIDDPDAGWYWFWRFERVVKEPQLGDVWRYVGGTGPVVGTDKERERTIVSIDRTSRYNETVYIFDNSSWMTAREAEVGVFILVSRGETIFNTIHRTTDTPSLIIEQPKEKKCDHSKVNTSCPVCMEKWDPISIRFAQLEME